MADDVLQHAVLLRPRTDAARRRYAVLAVLALALTLIVVLTSAYLRHAQDAVRCEVASECVAQRQAVAEARSTLMARGAHRLAASGVSLLVLAMAAIAWTQRGANRLPRRWPTLALALVVALAVLGVGTTGASGPATKLGNLIGGYALLAALAAAHSSLRPQCAGRAIRRLALVAVVLGFGQAVLGGLVEAESPLHLLHRANGLVLAGIVASLIVRLWAAPDFLATALTMTLCVGVAAGIAAALAPWALGAILLHGVLAAVLLALLARAAVR
jgi:heme A synthase